MPIEVVSLTEADISGAIQVIQRAFEDDPYFKWVFDASTVSQLDSPNTTSIIISTWSTSELIMLTFISS